MSPSCIRAVVPAPRVGKYTHRLSLYFLLGTLLPLTPSLRADPVQAITQQSYPKSIKSGAPIHFELWKWGEESDRKKLIDLTDTLRIPVESLPEDAKRLQFRFSTSATHDSIAYRVRSSDCFASQGTPKTKVEDTDPNHLYRVGPEGFPPQIGRYCLEVEFTNKDQIVSQARINIELIKTTPIPVNTTYMVGKKDSKGNPITTSKPVVLPPLNETPTMRDNDYPFEPQHAYNVINYERFPPFHLAPRFVAVYNSRRFSDEDKFGGPLNRGFSSLASIKISQDNLPISQRTWWYTSNVLESMADAMAKKDPEGTKDLVNWVKYRSAFVSEENSVKLGYKTYNAFEGTGGYSPYDASIYGMDEEEMWPDIASKLLKEHPEALPPELQKYKDRSDDPEAKATVNQAYIDAWANFLGAHYRGAREAAAERGRTIKVWHYGSKAPGENLFMGSSADAQPDPKTGKYKYEQLDQLWQWFKKDNKIDFTANEYCRQIDYFHKDFYFHVICPQYDSLYEKNQGGYILDDKGRRKIRQDEFEEKVYVTPVKMGKTEIAATPAFLKSFIAKGENALFWFNGGKYYKTRGTEITDKKLFPAFRPGNQETWWDTVKFGSRPVSPYMAEAAVIYTFMMGLEGFYYWDARNFTGPVGFGRDGKADASDTLGEIEFHIKGMHRVSQLNRLFEGKYSYVRPTRHYDTSNRDHPIIRGILNGQYLALAMTNPYLDPGETQEVEMWYGADYANRTRTWYNKVPLQARRTQLYQCKLPPLPAGQTYDPDKLYFRYVLQDGKYSATFTVTGNYDVPYPFK